MNSHKNKKASHVIPHFRIDSPLKHLNRQEIALRLFFTCWIIYVLHFTTNIVREIYPALSLGDHMSFDVSEYVGLHPDVFEIPGRGAFINNNPGASILGAIPYAIARPAIDIIVKQIQEQKDKSPILVERQYDAKNHPNSVKFYRVAVEKGLDVKLALAAGVIQAFCMAPLSAFSTVLMFLVLIRLVSSIRIALVLALLYAFATPIFFRTGHLNHNLLAAHFSFFSFVLLWRPLNDSPDFKWYHYFFAGLLCGWTVVFDYSGIVVVFALSIYALIRWKLLPKEKKSYFDLLNFGIGVFLAGAVLIGYQWLSFGNPFYPAQHYMPDVEYIEQGYHGFTWPQLDLLWKTAFGMRYGLFTSAPLLLLFFYFPAWCRKKNRFIGSLELHFIIIFIIAFFLFCAANQYGRIQFNTGVRHILPVTPFLFLLVANVFIKLPKLVAVLIAIIATYWSWCLAMYRDVEFGLGIL